MRTRTVWSLAAIALVALVTLGPPALVGPLRGWFVRGADAAMAPLALTLPSGELEMLANVALFVPVGLVLGVVLRRAWPLAAVLGAFASFAVEVAQASIPGRVPDAVDIVCNTAGATIGALLVGAGHACVAIRRTATR